MPHLAAFIMKTLENNITALVLAEARVAVRMFFLPVSRTIELARSRNGWWVFLTIMSFWLTFVTASSANASSTNWFQDTGYLLPVMLVLVLMSSIATLWLAIRFPRRERVKELEHQAEQSLESIRRELLVICSEMLTEEGHDAARELKKHDIICRFYLQNARLKFGLSQMQLIDSPSEKLRLLIDAGVQASNEFASIHECLVASGRKLTGSSNARTITRNTAQLALQQEHRLAKLLNSGGIVKQFGE